MRNMTDEVNTQFIYIKAKENLQTERQILFCYNGLNDDLTNFVSQTR